MKKLHSISRVLLALSLIAVMAVLSGCAIPGLMEPSKPAQPVKPAPLKGTTVALVLPRGHQVGVVNALIEGANLGVESQKGTQNPVRVRVVYTDGDWLQQLAALPDRTVIGGPLNKDVYSQMKSAGIMNKKVVFAFLNQLPAGDEGISAWRFFPSMKDQVSAVARFCVDELDVRDIASFGPKDAIATAAVAQLEQELATRDIVLTRIETSGQPETWGEIVKPYVDPLVNESNGTLVPQTPFRAVFLPDSWMRVLSVHTAFGSNGEDRLVMLGTMLWDAANARGNTDAARYVKVAWPSPFVKTQIPASLTGAANISSFWGALGYDFVRFAARLGVSGRPASAVVTNAAAQTARMYFAMAQLSYDGNGIASQKLYMVQPDFTGPKIADASAIKTAMAEAERLVEERGNPAELVPAPSAPPPAVQPATSAPIMREGPNSSYRLSLPGVKR